ncbi:hypothetical protein TNCT_403161 [Trichonephila clavata]|uniref:Uncharacterized protein n=1 Tax=Trichonephila clavata TaxID=2740835 RepID=A0A8X6J558_TRICU|nr:hypothetical protein TNCT_403161 [Trichonephila clavata]
MELVSNSACLYSTIQCLQPVHGQQDTFRAENDPSTTKQWLNVHEYLDFDEQQGSIRQGGPETSRASV